MSQQNQTSAATRSQSARKARHGRLSKFGAERAQYMRSARSQIDPQTRAKFVALARAANRDLVPERRS